MISLNGLEICFRKKEKKVLKYLNENYMSMNYPILRWLKHYILSLSAVIFLVFLNACGSGQNNSSGTNDTMSSQGDFRSDTATVQTVEVQPHNFSREINSTGTLNAKQHAQLRVLVPGKITKVNVDIGDHVKKGDVLLQIRKRNYQLALEQADANLARSKAQDNNAKREYERAKNLYLAGSTSEQQRDQAESAYQQAEAAFKQAKAAYDDAQQKLDDTTILAPYDGFITQRLVMEGGFANTGQAAFEITDLSTLEAEMDIPERYAGSIPKGLKAKITFLANFAPHAGVVSHVNPSVDSNTGTFEIKVRLKNADHTLPNGLFCTGAFELPTLKNQPAVPEDAIIENEGQTVVWVIKDGKAQQREVTKGATQGNWVMIDKGLEIGERVAVSGTSVLIDGYPVKSEDAHVSAKR